MTEHTPLTRRTIDPLFFTKTLLFGLLVALTSFFMASNAGAEEGSSTISQVDLELEGAPLTQLESAGGVLSNDVGVTIVSVTIADGGYKKVVTTDGSIPIGNTTAVSNQQGYERLFAAPIQAADYILVVETNGDAELTLTGLDEYGLPRAGSEKSLQSFQWNTGIAAKSGETYWISVIAADSLAGSQGIRTQSDLADVQILPLQVVSEEKLVLEKPQKVSKQPREETKPEVTVEESNKPETSRGEIAFHASAAVEKSADNCEGEDVLNAEPQTEIVFCYLVTNIGSVPLTDVKFSDESLDLSDMYLPRVIGNDLLFPGESAVYSTKLTSTEISTIFAPKVSAAVADAKGATQKNIAKAVADDSVQIEIASLESPEEFAVAGASQETPLVEEVLPKDPVADAESSPEDVEVSEEVEEPTVLAFTGIETTLILLVLAAGAVFFGNTIRLAAVSEKRKL